MLYVNFVGGARPPTPTSELFRVAVLDLDGTLFSDEYRLYLAAQHNWSAYQAAALSDPLNARLVERLRVSDYDAFIIVSGRYADLAPATLSLIPVEVTKRVIAIGMRERERDKDVPTLAFKAAVLRRFKLDLRRAGFSNVEFDVFDDDERVLKLFRSTYSRSKTFRFREAYWVNRANGSVSVWPFESAGTWEDEYESNLS